MNTDAAPVTPTRWRGMTGADIDGVVAVARSAFPEHFEARACFEERLALFPEGCFVLDRDVQVAGYLIAYPWPRGAIPPLNSALGALPPSIEDVYLHDLAFAPEARGQGHARPIVQRLVEEMRGRGARRIALVSVNGTRGFWQAMGFAPVAGDEALSRKLESYGEGACYMVRELQGVEL